jgi:hypothetical protein
MKATRAVESKIGVDPEKVLGDSRCPKMTFILTPSVESPQELQREHLFLIYARGGEIRASSQRFTARERAIVMEA